MPRGIYKRSPEQIERIASLNRGKKMPEEVRNKVSLSKRGQTPWMKGKTHSEDAKEKNRKAHIGKVAWNKGKPMSEESRIKLSNALKGREVWNKGIHYEQIAGAKHHNWKGGVTPENMKARKSVECKEWRTAVFERDDYTCVNCGERGGKLNADHIKPFCDYPELRFSVDNGRTLCVPCHREIGWSLFKERNPMKITSTTVTTHSIFIGYYIAP